MTKPSLSYLLCFLCMFNVSVYQLKYSYGSVSDRNTVCGMYMVQVFGQQQTLYMIDWRCFYEIQVVNSTSHELHVTVTTSA